MLITAPLFPQYFNTAHSPLAFLTVAHFAVPRDLIRQCGPTKLANNAQTAKRFVMALRLQHPTSSSENSRSRDIWQGLGAKDACVSLLCHEHVLVIGFVYVQCCTPSILRAAMADTKKRWKPSNSTRHDCIACLACSFAHASQLSVPR